MEREGGAALQQVDSPLFASYVTLKAEIEYARWSIAWCRWVAEHFENAMIGSRSKEE